MTRDYLGATRDYSGNPIFEFRDPSGLTRFFPYSLDTIHEYIKAKQELSTKNVCGAV